MLFSGRMHGLLCVILIITPIIYGKPYQDIEHDERAEPRFTVHENPPELVVSASPDGVKVQAKPSKLQVIEYPHDVAGQKRDGGGCFGHDCGGSRYDGGGGYDGGHLGRFSNVGFDGGFRGHDVGCGFGHLDNCGHDEHTTYVPSHTPPVHVGPNAPPIHVGPHVPAVHVGPHVPSIHYGTHAPIYHVGPHVPFVHMPPPVTTVHAGPMGPPIHVSSPPTVYHQPPVVYHMPHLVGHAANDDGGDGGYGGGAHHYVGGGHEAVGGYGGGYNNAGYGGGAVADGGYGAGGVGLSSGHGSWGRSTISHPAKKEKRNVHSESADRNKRQSVNYGWHPFPASVHVGPHTPPIHIGPHYPPVHIGPHVPAVHIGPHVPYINIPAHVPAIHVRPHVPAVHISPPVPIINAGNHVPAVHVTSPPTVYHRPPIVIHQPHIVHGHHHGMGDAHGHEIYGNYGNSMMGNGHMMGGDGSYMAGHDTGNFVNNVGHDGGMVTGHDGGYMNGVARDGGGFMGSHDGGMMGGHEGFMGQHEGNGGGYMGKRDNIPKNGLEQGSLSVKSLYSMIRPRRQILGGGGDGGDSVIFVHPGGSQSPVGPNVRGESPLAGLEQGVGLRSGLGSSPVESPARGLASRQGNAFVKSGLSGLGSIANSLGSQESSFGGLTAGHGIPSGLAGLGGLQNPLSGLSGNDGAALGAGDDTSGGLPDGIGPAMGSSSLRSSSIAGPLSNSPLGGGAMSDSVMGGSSLNTPETSQATHDDGFTGDSSGMSLGGLQPAGGGFSEDNGHVEDSSSMNYQRSLFPSPNFSQFTSFEQDLDSSTERDTKSTILRDEERDNHERIHRDFIPRPVNYGHY